MIRLAWNTWWRIVIRRDPWIALAWIIMGGVFLMGLLTLAVVSTAAPRLLLHPGLMEPPLVPNVKALGGVIGVTGLVLGGLPFGLAGLLGLFGHAVRDRVTWGTFWRLGWHYYDRGWALIAAVVLYGGALSLVGLILRAIAPVLTIVAIPTAILGAPLMIRVVGGLFVDGLPWPQTVRRAFVRGGYGTLMWGTVWATVAGGILGAGALEALRIPGYLGASFSVMDVVFTIVAGPLWFLALYRVTVSGADDVWECLLIDHPRVGQEMSAKDRVRRAIFPGL